jgi:putative phosphoribosyl transferase
MFLNRSEAGQRLAKALIHYKDATDSIVLALPRGGVIIGYEISRELHVPLDVLVTRKLGTPGNPELAMGALSETGARHLNPDVLAEFSVSAQELEEEVQRQQQEIERRVSQYRAGRPLPPLAGKTVLLVDDGIATGATFYASLSALRGEHVQRLVAAVPVAPPRAKQLLSSMVDEVLILETPALFFGIGQFYAEFPQVEDDEVNRCLDNARRPV